MIFYFVLQIIKIYFIVGQRLKQVYNIKDTDRVAVIV